MRTDRQAESTVHPFLWEIQLKPFILKVDDTTDITPSNVICSSILKLKSYKKNVSLHRCCLSEAALLLAEQALGIPKPSEHLQSLGMLQMGIMGASKHCMP